MAYNIGTWIPIGVQPSKELLLKEQCMCFNLSTLFRDESCYFTAVKNSSRENSDTICNFSRLPKQTRDADIFSVVILNFHQPHPYKAPVHYIDTDDAYYAHRSGGTPDYHFPSNHRAKPTAVISLISAT